MVSINKFLKKLFATRKNRLITISVIGLIAGFAGTLNQSISSIIVIATPLLLYFYSEDKLQKKLLRLIKYFLIFVITAGVGNKIGGGESPNSTNEISPSSTSKRASINKSNSYDPAEEYRQDYRRRMDKLIARYQNYKEMWEKSQWVGTNPTYRNEGTKPIYKWMQLRIYIDPNTKEIYELQANWHRSYGYIARFAMNWDRMAMSTKKLGIKKLGEKFKKGSQGGGGSVFVIEGDELILYQRGVGQMNRRVWGVRNAYNPLTMELDDPVACIADLNSSTAKTPCERDRATKDATKDLYNGADWAKEGYWW